MRIMHPRIARLLVRESRMRGSGIISSLLVSVATSLSSFLHLSVCLSEVLFPNILHAKYMLNPSYMGAFYEEGSEKRRFSGEE